MSYTLFSYCFECAKSSIKTKDHSEIDTVLPQNESQRISGVRPLEFIYIKSKTKQPRMTNQLCQRIKTYKSENKY